MCCPFFEFSTKLNRHKMALLATRELGAWIGASSKQTKNFSAVDRREEGTSSHVFSPVRVEGRYSVFPGTFSLSCDEKWTWCSQWVLSFQIEVCWLIM